LEKIPHPPYLPWAYYSAKDKYPVFKYEIMLSIECPYEFFGFQNHKKEQKMTDIS
jgi:hypothetical protein